MTGQRRCHYCGEADVALTRDHIVPRARGGIDSSWNLVDSCVPCNLAKGKAMPTCTCSRCTKALAQWISGVRGPTRAQQRSARPSPPGMEDIPPDLACLSPAMRDLLMRRRRSESQ
jgi:hypothetical protein